MKSSSAPGTPTVFSYRNERIALLVIVVVAVALRLVRLGALSFSGDEETTTLAAIALLEGWPPQLPGGLIYLRALPFTILEALMVAVGDVSEFNLRLVPALVAGPRVAAAWWLARSFLGPGSALAVAALLAVAPLDVELSRTARMYSLFATFDLIFVAAVVRIAASNTGAVWAAASAAFAPLTHVLAVMHAPLPFIAAIARGLSARARWRLIAVGAIVLAAFLGQQQLTSFSSRHIMWGRVATQSNGSVLAAHLERLGQVLASPPGALLAIAGALAALVCTAVVMRQLRNPVARIGALIAFAAWIGASPILGALCLLGTLMLEGTPLVEFLRRARGLAGAGLAATLGWLVAAIVASLSGGFGADFPARVLLGFPAPNWLELARAAPGLFGLAALGGLVAADRGARSPQPAPWLVLIAAAYVPVLAGGFEMRTSGLRYQIHALAPLIVLAVLAAEWLAGRVLRKNAVIVGVSVLMVAVALRPDQSLKAVLREHGPISEPFAVLNVAPDHRGAAEFVRTRVAEGDWIAAEDALQQRVYAGRADLWLRRFEDAAMFLRRDPQDGRVRDVYVGSLHVNDLQHLRALAEQEGRRVVWLVTSGEVEGFPEWFRTAETDATLKAWRPLAWFVGADALTRVYRLVDGEPSPPPSDEPGTS